MNSKLVLLSVMILFVLVSGTIYFTYKQKENGLYYTIEKSENSLLDQQDNTENLVGDLVDEQLTNSSMSNQDFQISDKSNNEIYVHVYGAIVHEGVYSLDMGARVFEVLKLAGGFTNEASRGYVNLARVLVDGESIYFPTTNDEVNLTLSQSEKVVDDGLVNINSATIDELTQLPGIGEAKARSIIAFRTMNGEFGVIEDIKKVSGIKESLFLAIKDMIKV